MHNNKTRERSEALQCDTLRIGTYKSLSFFAHFQLDVMSNCNEIIANMLTYDSTIRFLIAYIWSASREQHAFWRSGPFEMMGRFFGFRCDFFGFVWFSWKWASWLSLCFGRVLYYSWVVCEGPFWFRPLAFPLGAECDLFVRFANLRLSVWDFRIEICSVGFGCDVRVGTHLT